MTVQIVYNSWEIMYDFNTQKHKHRVRKKVDPIVVRKSKVLFEDFVFKSKIMGKFHYIL